MRSLREHTKSRHIGPASRPPRAARRPYTPADSADEAPEGRYEAQAITTRSVPSDPYLTWLRQRETEREQAVEPSPIHWVDRRGGTASPANRGARRSNQRPSRRT